MLSDPSTGVLAIAMWQGRVSPVFDSARHLVLVRLGDIAPWPARISADKPPSGDALGGVPLVEATIDGVLPEHRVRRLLDLQARALISGAISRPLAWEVQRAGIRLVPFVAGPVDEVLRAFREGRLERPEFRMPGCRGSGRRARCLGTGFPASAEGTRTTAASDSERGPRPRIARVPGMRPGECRRSLGEAPTRPGFKRADHGPREEDGE